MAAKIHGELSRVSKIPKDTRWVVVTQEMLFSPAWRGMSINCRRLMDFLMLEHMAHAGTENGNLYATYDQLEAFGIPRRLVHRTLTEAERLGLVLIERGGRKNQYHTHPTRFTLTCYPALYADSTGRRLYAEAGHQWRRTTWDDVTAIRAWMQRRNQKTRVT
ncbi:MAG: hypothetical protein H6908_00670 [Hyphomicrobiales bacterium]|nr:hypothetical protein [Rickettsiales bacterium]MCP5361144.1 hypothetical protein [Hyphomicrobiales bacterium]